MRQSHDAIVARLFEPRRVFTALDAGARAGMPQSGRTARRCPRPTSSGSTNEVNDMQTDGGTAQCPQCDQTFQPRKRWQRFCSSRCKAAYWYALNAGAQKAKQRTARRAAKVGRAGGADAGMR